nr:nitroreductase family protein [Methylicorpusculum oleiharenae]
MCKYYEKHLDDGIDISDFYSREDYEFFRNLTVLNNEIIKTHNHDDYFKNNRSDFLVFSKSRSSVRNFTGEKIPFNLIENAIGIAKTAPSVCNRQPCRVYYIENKIKIDSVFAIQQGLVGYSDNIYQLLVLVADKNYYYTVGERNQLYIDGGLFLMNLLYALHYYSIGACPAHWGLNHDKDKLIQNELQLSDSERVICLVPIGIPNESFKTTLSLRRENEEILKIVSS